MPTETPEPVSLSGSGPLYEKNDAAQRAAEEPVTNPLDDRAPAAEGEQADVDRDAGESLPASDPPPHH